MPLTKNQTTGEVIDDFVHSDNPKFAGKSKKKRIQMAIAAHYSKMREDAEQAQINGAAKKPFSTIRGTKKPLQNTSPDTTIPITEEHHPFITDMGIVIK